MTIFGSTRDSLHCFYASGEPRFSLTLVDGQTCNWFLQIYSGICLLERACLLFLS